MPSIEGRPGVDLMIVGAQKAATTSILEYMRQLPETRVQRLPEMSYFSNPPEWEAGYSAAFATYFGSTDAAAAAQRLVVGKHANLMSMAAALHRLHDHNPAVHVLVSLRDPVDRAYSAYWWARRQGIEELPSFEAALDAGPQRMGSEPTRLACDYLGNGEYAPRIRRLYEIFGRDRVHAVFDTEFFAAPAAALTPALAAFGITPDPAVGLPRKNTAAVARSERLARAIRGSRRLRSAAHVVLPRRLTRRAALTALEWNSREAVLPPLPASTAARLAQHYQPYDAELRNLLSRELPWADRHLS